MRQIIVLDTGPLGMISNPRPTPQNDAAKSWLRACLARDALVVLPEVADYEVRRELLLYARVRGLERLNALRSTLEFLPSDSAIMLEAARLWAQARKSGRPTADRTALDVDIILAAQAVAAAAHFAGESEGGDLIVATTNTKHLQRFVNAQEWQDII